MSKEEIANAFVNHFYQALDSNPGMLMGLYVRASTLELSYPVSSDLL